MTSQSIDFRNPNVGKPANLKNSAVLRMLEEEENMQRNGYGPGNHQSRNLRERSWPPPEYEQKNQIRSAFKDVVIPGAKRVAWPPPNEAGLEGPYSEHSSVPSQVAPRPQAKPVAPPPSTITLRPQAPISQVPAPLVTSQPATATLKEKLVSPRNLRGDIKWPPEEVKKKMIEEAQNQQNCNSFLSLEGGKHLRGDLKWPPENVKSQMEEENRLRLELAKGPAVRPPKQLKDYTGFFEQHALSDTYPGYKIPPGTQFYRPV
nr:unnamed protein product [Callosobruchus chinensis]